jgi:hypothetical protein
VRGRRGQPRAPGAPVAHRPPEGGWYANPRGAATTPQDRTHPSRLPGGCHVIQGERRQPFPGTSIPGPAALRAAAGAHGSCVADLRWTDPSRRARTSAAGGVGGIGRVVRLTGAVAVSAESTSVGLVALMMARVQPIPMWCTRPRTPARTRPWPAPYSPLESALRCSRPRSVAGEGTRLRHVLLRWQALQPCLPSGRRASLGPTWGRRPLRWTLRRLPAYPSRSGGRIAASHAPRGASRPQTPRPTSPPRGSGAARPQGALRAIDASACPHSWRTFGPRRLRRQLEDGLVAT